MAYGMKKIYDSVPSHSGVDDDDDEDRQYVSRGGTFGKRHIQIIIYTGLVFIASATRVDMSLCIVAMTNPSASINENIKTFNWTDKSLVLSSFIWGYMVPQSGFGWLASHYGPKWFLLTGLVSCSLLGLLLPTIAVSFGSHGVMVCRCLQGFCQGGLFPSVQALLGKWAPINERSRMGSFVYGGGPSGILLGTLISGYIASSWYGWPMVFYTLYSALLLWSIISAWVISNSPADHPTITREEFLYIERSLCQEEHSENSSTPWKSIFGSTPFWALMITQIGYTWGYWTLMTEIPYYMSSVMKFSLEANGVLSSIPYLVQWLLGIVFSCLSDWLINRKICSIGKTRKLMNIIGLIVPAGAMIALGECKQDDSMVAVLALIVAGGITSACLSGHIVNHMDLSPRYCGILMGIANHAAIIISALSPTLVQYLVTNEEDPNQWKIIFLLASALNVVATIIFTIFGSGEVQRWN